MTTSAPATAASVLCCDHGAPCEHFGALGVDVEGPDRRVPVQRGDHACVVAALLPAAEDRRRRPARGRPAADADAARRRRPRGGDLGRVHHGCREPGLRVVDDDQAGDVREASLLVGRVAGHPLERRHVLVGEVGGHRVDERVLARMDAGLRRQLDTASRHGAVRLARRGRSGRGSAAGDRRPPAARDRRCRRASWIERPCADGRRDQPP